MYITLEEGIHRCLLFYGKLPHTESGLNTALHFLVTQSADLDRTVIISYDAFQAGEVKDVCRYAANLFNEFRIKRLIGIGKGLLPHMHLFDTANKKFYSNASAFLQEDIQMKNFDSEAILLFNPLSSSDNYLPVQLFQKSTHVTQITVNLRALQKNIRFYRSILSKYTRLMAVLKANAYGHGAVAIGRFLQAEGIDAFALAYTDEGISLRQAGIRIPLLIMNPSVHELGDILTYDLQPEIYSLAKLDAFGKQVNLHDRYKTLRVHLKVDTGMKRLGLEITSFDKLLNTLKKYPQIHLEGVMTHLAAADNAQEKNFTESQIFAFKDFTKRLEKVLGYSFSKHILNSAGIAAFPNYQMDMIRLGIGLYGVDSTHEKNLFSVSTFKTIISQIRHLNPGDSVSYGRTWQAKKKSKVATIAAGYADGISRRGSNRAYLLANGKIAPIVGRVCMDMTVIDVSAIDVREGDEVIVFGENLPILKQAKQNDTIPHEMLTAVGSRVRRVYCLEIAEKITNGLKDR